MKNSASVSALILAFSAIAGIAVLSTACGDDDATPNNTSSSSTSGASGTSGGTSGTSGASGTSGTSGASGTSGTSGSTSGDPALAQATASCERTKKCTPNAFAAKYADVAACATATKSTGTATDYPGVTEPDADKCAKAYAAQPCEVDIFHPVPADCGFTGAGTLADATKCNFGAQCANGACTAVGSDGCGTCSKAGAKGDDCSATKPCGSTLFCDGTKCADPIAKDGDCTISQLSGCAVNTTCTASATAAGKCKAVVGIDQDCETTLIGSTCYGGLFCNADKKCKEPTFGAVDAECNGTDKQCKQSACDVTAKKCVAYIATGGTCDGAAKQCDPSKDSCDLAGDKTCKAIKAGTANVCK